MACGLPEKKATSIQKEYNRMRRDEPANHKMDGLPRMSEGQRPLSFRDRQRVMRRVADIFAKQVASRLLGINGRVHNVTEQSLWPGNRDFKIVRGVRGVRVRGVRGVRVRGVRGVRG